MLELKLNKNYLKRKRIIHMSTSKNFHTTSYKKKQVPTDQASPLTLKCSLASHSWHCNNGHRLNASHVMLYRHQQGTVRPPRHSFRKPTWTPGPLSAHYVNMYKNAQLKLGTFFCPMQWQVLTPPCLTTLVSLKLPSPLHQTRLSVPAFSQLAQPATLLNHLSKNFNVNRAGFVSRQNFVFPSSWTMKFSKKSGSTRQQDALNIIVSIYSTFCNIA